jgi:hypothetical protein
MDGMIFGPWFKRSSVPIGHNSERRLHGRAPISVLWLWGAAYVYVSLRRRGMSEQEKGRT